MKTRDQIISYIEGRYDAIQRKKDKHPEYSDNMAATRMVLEEILDYCHEGETDEPKPPMPTTPYITTPPTYCYFEPSQPCFYGGNCLACTKYNRSTLTTATNTGDNE